MLIFRIWNRDDFRGDQSGSGFFFIAGRIRFLSKVWCGRTPSGCATLPSTSTILDVCDDVCERLNELAWHFWLEVRIQPLENTSNKLNSSSDGEGGGMICPTFFKTLYSRINDHIQALRFILQKHISFNASNQIYR